MALNWSWEKKIGQVVYKNGYEADLYEGNAFLICIHPLPDDCYTMGWFAVDREHWLRMLGLRKGWDGSKDNMVKGWNIERLRLNLNYKVTQQVVADLAKSKTPIIIEMFEEE